MCVAEEREEATLLAAALCRTKPLALQCVTFGMFQASLSLCRWRIGVRSQVVEKGMRNEGGEKEECGRKAERLGCDLN